MIMAVITVDNKNFNDIVNTSEKPVLLEFWAPWCVYCRRLSPALDRTAGKMEDKIVVGKVNIDENPDLAEKFDIDTIPALILFKKGAHGDTLVGPPSQSSVEEWVNSQI